MITILNLLFLLGRQPFVKKGDESHEDRNERVVAAAAVTVLIAVAMAFLPSRCCANLCQRSWRNTATYDFPTPGRDCGDRVPHADGGSRGESGCNPSGCFPSRLYSSSRGS